jgi:sulfite reductase (ferredoxin)
MTTVENEHREKWLARLSDSTQPEWAREAEIFEQQIALRKQGKVEERLFAETRLRRGVYGQRYDNGHRHDGFDNQVLAFEPKESKGPETVWDAPGMVRIKIPYGGVTARQLEVMADLAEEYADGIAHVTTRQDIQLHFVHIEDTPDLMRRLAAVGITTREACGNSVRNVTACPYSGVCRAEAFDVTPYAHALTFFLLGHPDAQDFGRKFKIAFSGCKESACGLVGLHDMGYIAQVRTENGKEVRGFQFYVGGGLGAVPHQAELFSEFLPEEELFPMAQAVCRVFGRLGEKKNRAKARIKFLVAKMGIQAFREETLKARAELKDDPKWTDWLAGVREASDQPTRPAEALVQIQGKTETALSRWRASNTRQQRQDGYVWVTLNLPLGDVTATQLRRLADVARRYVGDNIRLTVEQNIVLRFVAECDVPDMHEELSAIGLAAPDAESLVDVTSCPGTDTCKLGISSSRGLASVLRTAMAERSLNLDAAIKGLRIKVSGCFNSCGQHHVADLGFYGVSRKKGSHVVPHFQVVLGGKWEDNAGSYGLAMGAVPSKRIPEVVDRILEHYLENRKEQESFHDYTRRLGKVEMKNLLEGLTEVPAYDVDSWFYSDWGDPREYSMSDHGIGECAGAVVPQAEFGLQDSERQVFEAQVRLEEQAFDESFRLAYAAMLKAARTLVQLQYWDVSEDAESVLAEFRTRFCDTGLFYDRFAGGKFASYLFDASQHGSNKLTATLCRQRVEEAQLFIEAAHACYERIGSKGAAA